MTKLPYSLSMGDVFIRTDAARLHHIFAVNVCKSHTPAKTPKGKNGAFILIFALFGVTLHTKYE